MQRCPLWVKMRKSHREHFSSALHPKAAVGDSDAAQPGPSRTPHASPRSFRSTSGRSRAGNLQSWRNTTACSSARPPRSTTTLIAPRPTDSLVSRLPEASDSNYDACGWIAGGTISEFLENGLRKGELYV